MPKSKFDINKFQIEDFKILKGQIDTSDDFIKDSIVGFESEVDIAIGFNLDSQLAKCDFTIGIATDSGNEIESKAKFDFVFIYKIDNISELTSPKDDALEVDSLLLDSIASISYSTARGVLITRLQGTVFQNFILQIADAKQLLKNQS